MKDQPGLVKSFLEAQDMRYGTHDPYGDHILGASTLDQAPRPHKHIGRNLLVGLTTTAVAAGVFQYIRTMPPETPGQESAAVVPTVEAPANNGEEILPDNPQAGENTEHLPASNPETLTFSELFKKGYFTLGTVHMRTDGQGAITYKEGKKRPSVGTLTVTHEQVVELYARPLLKDGKATNPITIEARDDGTLLATFDRSKLVISPDVSMPGPYTLSRATDKTATVTYAGESTDDSFRLSYLTPGSKTIEDAREKISDDVEKGVVPMLLDGSSDALAKAGAQVISLKISNSYMNSLLTDTCLANPTDTTPGGVLKLAEQTATDRVIDQLYKWGALSGRQVAVQIVGDYPEESTIIREQISRYINTSNDVQAQANARDAAAAIGHNNAKYFDFTAKTIVCTPDEQLRSVKK